MNNFSIDDALLQKIKNYVPQNLIIIDNEMIKGLCNYCGTSKDDED